MALHVPDEPFALQSNSDPRADGSCNEVDIPPDAKSNQEPISNEEEASQLGKHVSVDSLSCKESSSSSRADREPRDSLQHLALPPSTSKPKLVSRSLPNLVTSTPRVSTTLKKRWGHDSHASPTLVDALARQDSEAFLFLGSWRNNLLQTSSSDSEHRLSTAFDDLDIVSPKVSSREFNIKPSYHSPAAYSYSVYPPRADPKKDTRKKGKSYYSKCCWYMPNFGKIKPIVRAKNNGDTGHAISTRVSLEKFECGSWAESGIVNEPENISEDSSSYFDLPLELIRSGIRDAISPVRTAFYFDNDASKGSRKNMSTRKSHSSSSSSRHARSSSSSCHTLTITISPRWQTARHEFNAYLEAQGS